MSKLSDTQLVILSAACQRPDFSVYPLATKLPGAAATEHVLANLQLPGQCLIAAVAREDFVKVPGADDRLIPGDTVVALIQDSALDQALPIFMPRDR